MDLFSKAQIPNINAILNINYNTDNIYLQSLKNWQVHICLSKILLQSYANLCPLLNLNLACHDLPREAEHEPDEDDWSRKVNGNDEKV